MTNENKARDFTKEQGFFEASGIEHGFDMTEQKPIENDTTISECHVAWNINNGKIELAFKNKTVTEIGQAVVDMDEIYTRNCRKRRRPMAGIFKSA